MGRRAVQGWIDPEALARLGGGGLERLLARLDGLAPLEWLRRAPGRETFVWPGEPGLVVKRVAGRVPWRERLRAAGTSLARREAEALLALRAAGVRVPRPLAWVAAADGRRGALVMERVPGGPDLASAALAADPPRRERLARLLCELVARLHGAGWTHRDLYLHHLRLVEGAPVLFDAGRVRRADPLPERWLVKDLAALLSTLPAGVPRALALRFAVRWSRALGRGRPARAFLRAVARKGERMRRHRPRFVEPGGRLDPARAARTTWDARSATS